MISYLQNYREEEPEYIARYLRGEQITFRDIMSFRVGYYAGYYQRCNCDGTLIKVGNKSHSVHSFLYADSVKRETLEGQIAKEGSFRGYHPVGKIEWQESDIMPSGQHLILKPIRNIHETPYCSSLVMERDEDKDDTYGAEHFVVTFLFGISIKYYWLFRKEYSKAPWLFILNEGYNGTTSRWPSRDACLKQPPSAVRYSRSTRTHRAHHIFRRHLGNHLFFVPGSAPLGINRSIATLPLIILLMIGCSSLILPKAFSSHPS